MKFPLEIQKLVEYFAQLPTVGPKTAERYVFYLLKQNPEQLRAFGQSLMDLPSHLITCSQCLSLATSNPCPICADPNRQTGQLCVIADTRDLLALEETKQYQGRYLVMSSAPEAITNSPDWQANVKQLWQRLQTQKIQEVILAFNPDLPGETACLYLTKLFKQTKLPIKTSRLAKGLPTGASLEYADQLTLGNALKFRNIL